MATPSDWVTEYIEMLRQRAADRRAEGAPTADLYDRVASELEDRRRAHLYSTPTTADAALESGYSPEQLRKLKRDGHWSGQRYDLPRRPGAAPRPETRGLTLADQIMLKAV